MFLASHRPTPLRHRALGQYTRAALAMDHIDPILMRVDFDCWPQDEFHGDSLTKVRQCALICLPRDITSITPQHTLPKNACTGVPDQ